MTTPRDIPFDEEVTERSPEARAAFANIRPLSEVEKRRARLAAEFDARVAAAAKPRNNGREVA